MLPAPTVSFMQKLAARKAPEVELYQQLGFPDFFTSGGWESSDEEDQRLSYGPYECMVMLRGSRVLGHPSEVNWNELYKIGWDGVARPQTYHAYRSHVQSIAPSIPPSSPLGRALRDFRPTDWRNQSPRWRRLVRWWALSRTAGDRNLAPLLKRALEQMGTWWYTVTALRLAAELVSPGFARRTLVAAGHWPASRLGVTKARVKEAFPAGYPDGYRVYCRATGEHLGPLYAVRPSFGVGDEFPERRRLSEDDRLYSPGRGGYLVGVRPQLDSDLHEEERFCEDDRATCWPLSTTGYALTGDGEIVRRDAKGWLRLGPAREALVIRPPKAERREQG